MSPTDPIPRNIRRIRISRGLSQENVASEAGISRTAYRSIEVGQAEPRVSNLQGIARALDVALPELLAEPSHLSSVRFRSNKTQSVKAQTAREQVVVDIAHWLKDFNSLEELLGQKKPYSLGCLANRLSASSGEDSIEAAGQARKALGLRPNEPVRDICGLLESAGVKVRVMELDAENIFGLSVAASDGGPAVIVNVRQDISVERRIFTAAHELGHLLLHPHTYDISEVSEDPNDEKQADLFASHFLMPAGVFKSEWNDTFGLSFVDRVLHVKRIFRVSYKTVLFRLVELGQADRNTVWKYFKFRYKQRYGVSLTKKVEPEGLVDLDFVESRLVRLVRQAVESEQITLSRGAEILGVTLTAMRDIVASWEIAA